MNKLKHTLFILVCGILGYGCLGSNSNTVADPSDNASVTYVAIPSNTASPNASSAVFTIDNINDSIYNVDSLPYGTRIDSLFVTFKFASSLGFVMNDTITQSNYYTEATTDRAYDFTKNVTIKNLASNGTTTKQYTIKLNVHQVQTYLHTWSRLTPGITTTASENQKAILLKNKFLFYSGTETANFLYESTDAAAWSAVSSLAGLPLGAKLCNIVTLNERAYLLHNNRIYITQDGAGWTQHAISSDTDYDYTSLLFSIKERLWAIARHKTNHSIRIASSPDGINWSFVGDRVFHANFPVSDYAATTFKVPYSNREKAIVIGGVSVSGSRLNTIWSAESKVYSDSLSWIDLQYAQSNLPVTASAATVYYGSKLLLVGGLLKDSNTPDTLQLRQSTNEGMNWAASDTTINKLPSDFIARSGTSIVHDEQNKSIYIIGGKAISGTLSDVWKIKVNFYNFADYKLNPYKY